MGTANDQRAGPGLPSGHRQEHKQSFLGGLKPASGFSLVVEVRMGETFTTLHEPRGNPKSAFLPCLSTCLSSCGCPAPSQLLLHSFIGWDGCQRDISDMVTPACSNPELFPDRIPAHIHLVTTTRDAGALQTCVPGQLPTSLIQGGSRLTSATLTELRSRCEQPP